MAKIQRRSVRRRRLRVEDRRAFIICTANNAPATLWGRTFLIRSGRRQCTNQLAALLVEAPGSHCLICAQADGQHHLDRKHDPRTWEDGAPTGERATIALGHDHGPPPPDRQNCRTLFRHPNERRPGRLVDEGAGEAAARLRRLDEAMARAGEPVHETVLGPRRQARPAAPGRAELCRNEISSDPRRRRCPRRRSRRRTTD